MIDDIELLSDFTEESEENLASAEEDFLTLESKREEADPNIINRAFRCVHSIKGGAGFLGLTHIGKLAHAMEALMDLIRQGKMKPDKNNMGFMLEGVDHLHAMFRNAAESNEYDIAEIHENIMNLVQKVSDSGEETQSMQSEKSEERRVPEPSAVSEEQEEEKGRQAAKSEADARDGSPELDAETQIRIVDECIAALARDKTEGQNWIAYAIEALQSIQKSAQEKGWNNIHRIGNALDKLLGDICAKKIEVDDTIVAAGEKGLDMLHTLFEDLENSNKVDVSGAYRAIALHCVNLEVEESMGAMGVTEAAEPVVETVGSESMQDTSRIPEKMESKAVTAAQVLQPQSRSSNAPQKTERPDTKAETESVRVKVSLLNRLISLAGEMVLVRNRQLQLMDRANAAMRNNAQKLDMVTSELQECVMRTRMQPVGTLFNKFNRVVRDLGKKLGKEIVLEVTGGEVELDKSILEGLSDPLTHMVRNACDHGIEAPHTRLQAQKPKFGCLNLHASHESGQVYIEVRDDGKGIDPAVIRRKVLEKRLRTEQELSTLSNKEILNLILLPGFTTAEKVSDVSGRGVGMDVVKSNIETIGGSLELDSMAGKGSAVRLRLPLTLAIIPSLIVRAAEYRYAIPQVNLEELVTLYNEEVDEKIENVCGKEVFRLRGQLLPLLRLKEILSRRQRFSDEDLAEISKTYRKRQKGAVEEFLKRKSESQWGDEKFRQSLTFAVLKAGVAKYGLIVDEVIGTEEIVVKSMHPHLKDLICYSGSTVMGDGRVALILDVMGLARHGNADIDNVEEASGGEVEDEAEDAVQSILLFKYGAKEQFAVSLNMVGRIECIDMNRIEEVGEKEFITVGGISTRILRMKDFLNVSPFEGGKEAYLLLPKMAKKPFGILISEIEDSLDCEVELSIDGHMEPGLLGTSLIHGRTALFVDLYALMEKAEPEEKEANVLPTVPAADREQTVKRVLLVEDVMFFRTLVKGYLKNVGYEVITAENGKVGLEELKKCDFDLIVSDIEMPVMDGFEFIAAVRNILNNTTIPALALTALTSDKDIQRIQEVGFDMYESKVDRDRLLSCVEELLA